MGAFMGTDGATVLIGLLGLLVNIAFLAFLVIQVSLLRKQVNEASEATVAERLRVQRQATVEYAASTLQRRHDLALKLPMESDQAAVSRYVEEVKSDRDKLQTLYNYLNSWEEFAAAVNTGIFDFDVVARTAGDVIVRVEEAYRAFVAKVRAEEDLPFLYVEIERLADSMREWDQKRREVQEQRKDLLA
jgi:hypothetical protein